MISEFRKEKVPFTQVANEVLNSPQLSFKAKGLYAYLFSKPDGWDFSSERIQKDSSDGRDSVRGALKELEEYGALQRKRHGDGKMEYLLKYAIQRRETRPRVDDPKTGNPSVGKTHSGKTRHVSNKDGENNKEEESNTYSPGAEAPEVEKVDILEKAEKKANEVNELIDCFSDVNPSFDRFFKNKTQRGAIHNLLKIHPQEKIKRVIGVLKQTNRVAYLPTITTPLQLEEKWASLESGLIKYKMKLQSENKPKGKPVTI